MKITFTGTFNANDIKFFVENQKDVLRCIKNYIKMYL